MSKEAARKRWLTLAGVMLAMFLGSLDQTVVGTAMPRIITDLGGFTHYTWVTTAYLITSTVVVPITGRLTDIYGRKWLYITGIAVFVAGSLLSGLSQTMTQLIIFRGFQGIGAGIMMANAFIVIGDLFPPAERGKYMGLISGVFGLSAIVGPILGGFITDNLSWHWVFLVNIPLGIAVVVLFLLFFPHIQPSNSKGQIDYWGIATLTLAVVPAMLALTWGGVEYPWGSPQIISLLVLSAAMTFLFIIIERRCQEPIIPLWIFKNQVVAVSMTITFLIGFAMFGGIVFIPLFFQGVLGASATASGSFLTPMMLGMVTGAFISGQLLSRAGGHYRLQGIVGLLIMAVGMALLSRMTAETSYTRAVMNIVLLGVGLGVTMPLYTVAIQNAVPYNVLGVATAAAAFFRSIGASLGLAVLGSVMTNRFTSEFLGGIPPAVKQVIPSEQLSSLVHNPQAVVSVEAAAQLRGMFSQWGPQGTALYEQVFQCLRQSLNSAIADVFLIGLVIVLVALVINLFLRQIPLRKQYMPADPPDNRK